MNLTANCVDSIPVCGFHKSTACSRARPTPGRRGFVSLRGCHVATMKIRAEEAASTRRKRASSARQKTIGMSGDWQRKLINTTYSNRVPKRGSNWLQTKHLNADYFISATVPCSPHITYCPIQKKWNGIRSANPFTLKQIGPTVWRMYNAKPENQKANSVERKRQHSATIAESNLNRGCLEPLRALGHKEVEEHRGNVNIPCNSL